MTLSARMARLEASRPPTQKARIIASDQEDYDTKLEEMLLCSRPGPLEVSGAIGGQVFNLTGVLKSHEEMLGELA